MKKFKLLFIALIGTMAFSSCGSDEKDEPEIAPSGNANNLSVVINADGTTSNGSIFSQSEGDSFYLDFIKYKVEDSHLTVVGHDATEISDSPVVFAKVTYKGITYNTRVIGESAFYQSKFSTISLPESLQIIRKNAFAGGNLKSIQIPKSVNRIELYAFSGCRFKSIELPDYMTHFELNAVSGCESLESLVIPEGPYHTYGPLSGCPKLTKLVLPSTLEYFNTTYSNQYVLSTDDLGLKELICYATTPPYGATLTYSYGRIDFTIYVPKESLELYLSHENWKYFKDNIRPIEN